MEIITKNGFKHLRLPDDKSLTSLLDFPEGTKFYAHPAQPPASEEVVARAVGISRSWEGGGRTSVTFDGSFEVPLLETYRIVPVASSWRNGGQNG